MSDVGIGELIWLVLAVLLGLGVVIAWIIKAEASRNSLRAEIKKMKAQLDASEREKIMVIEEADAIRGSGDSASGSMMIGKMAEKIAELEKDNERLKRELNEAKSSLEEVYKALCTK
jgi:uncharacterized membrane-anchored protein YhcB (DUF1043 family)